MGSSSSTKANSIEIPQTQGIKYAGSKLKLLPHILSLAQRTGAKSVLDGFAGTTRVSQAFAKTGYQVVCNDVSTWSRTFGQCYLLNRHEPAHYQELIAHLNGVKPRDGWFTEHYGADTEKQNSNIKSSAIDESRKRSDVLKKPWQLQNTRKLDGIRDEIERLELDDVTKAVALTSLILALDKVDSTLGHFVSYLKDWSPRSYNELKLEVPKLWMNQADHSVIQSDALEAAKSKVDLTYFDPPYGSNNEKMPPSRVRYASYYHVWTSIILNDRPPLFGKAARRADTSDTLAASVFEEFRVNPATNRFLAVEAIERLIQKTAARWIILSYSSGGRATAEDLNQVLEKNGRIAEVVELDYKKNVMAEMKWTNDWIRDTDRPNREFLFLLEK